MAASNRGACVLAGAIAPLFVAGGLFAWQGEGALSRLGAMGGAGVGFGVGVLVVTIVLPSALLGSLAGGAAARAFLVGLLLPIGILAVDGVRVAVDGPGEENAGATPFEESLRVVWRPVASLGSSPAAAPGEAEGVGEAVDPLDPRVLEERIRELQNERDGLRVALEGASAFGPAELQRLLEEERTRNEEVVLQLAEARRATEAVRGEVGQLGGKLRVAEQGLLDARRESRDRGKEVLRLREDLVVARQEAEYEKKDLLARIEALEGRAVESRIEKIRQAAFTAVGVVFEIVPKEMGGGLAIQTHVDAGRVHGTGLVISPTGKAMAVIRCGMGKDEKLGARILFEAPRGKITPGDLVYARIR